MPSFRPLSISARLVILYATSTFILIAISAVFLDWVLHDIMEKDNNQFLIAETENLRMVMRQYPGDTNRWKEEVEREPGVAASFYVKYYIRLFNERLEPMMETPGMARIVSPASFPAPIENLDPNTRGVRKTGIDGTPLMVLAVRAVPGEPERPDRFIQIALDLSHESAIMKTYRGKIAIVLFAGVLVAGMVGFAVTREGLRPLKAIARSIQSIGPKDLQARVGSKRWAGEIAVLADAFDGMLEKLESSFTILSGFSADLAHELRTPINNLRGEAEVVLFKKRAPEEYRQVLESSLEEYSRLSRMIDNLLFLAHADRKDTVLKKALINGRNELEMLLDFYDSLAQEKKIKITMDGEATFEADPILFRQAVGNVLSNAFQYTDKGGHISLKLMKGGGSTQLEITDTGIGIEPEQIARVFDRFFRTDRARLIHPQGSGLGFSILKSIMDLHGGSVSVRSTPGEGTSVTLVFPEP